MPKVIPLTPWLNRVDQVRNEMFAEMSPGALDRLDRRVTAQPQAYDTQEGVLLRIALAAELRARAPAPDHSSNPRVIQI